MGALVDGFGGKISGELIRASDWNGMLAARRGAGRRRPDGDRGEAVRRSKTRSDDLGTRVTALESAIVDLTNVAATLRARYRRMNLTAASARFVIGQRGEITATVTSFDGTAAGPREPGDAAVGRLRHRVGNARAPRLDSSAAAAPAAAPSRCR